MNRNSKSEDGLSYTQRDVIIKGISNYHNNLFNIEYVTKNISRLTIPNTDRNKYLVHGGPEVYTKTARLTEYIQDIKKLLNEGNSIEDLFFIPFYRPINGYDIGNFLVNDDAIIAEELDIELDFEILPADFNLEGIKKFVYEMDELRNSRPIYGSNNTFNNFLDYFEKAVIENKMHSELVIPKQLLKDYPNSKAISDIFERLTKIKEII